MERKETIVQNAGFIRHVFNFDEDTKIDLLNIIQYAFLSLIPMIFLNKSIQRFIPESDDKKGSFEILAEVLAQIVVMFVGIFFINRIVTYVPTYSGEKYPEFNLITVILAFLMILLSLQSKLGEKVTILTDRVYDMWGGDAKQEALTGSKKNKNKVTSSQPIAGHQPSRADTSNLGLLPPGATGGMTMTGAPGGPPDFNSMYVNQNNPLPNAANPQDSPTAQMNASTYNLNASIGGEAPLASEPEPFSFGGGFGGGLF
tara:strand:- start:1215 stop:1988 length:774 start_codon:yes stop_codon:yes gene_type:complete